jgi:hypothetical protein
MYPIEGIDLHRLAYFFDYRVENVSTDTVRKRLSAVVDEWRRRWSEGTPPSLTYERGPNWISISDTRGDDSKRVSFKGWRVAAYEYCAEKPHSLDRVSDHIAAGGGQAVESTQIGSFLDSCVEERLMVCESGRYFGLAIPKNQNW